MKSSLPQPGLLVQHHPKLTNIFGPRILAWTLEFACDSACHRLQTIDPEGMNNRRSAVGQAQAFRLSSHQGPARVESSMVYLVQ